MFQWPRLIISIINQLVGDINGFSCRIKVLLLDSIKLIFKRKIKLRIAYQIEIENMRIPLYISTNYNNTNKSFKTILNLLNRIHEDLFYEKFISTENNLDDFDIIFRKLLNN